ncbi:hypothetical protein SAMN03159338_2783 [Sphingomonas sp. NFR04]|jgi:hypothetical protein|nr:hypothetical protein SAMN03159338_2783 [Sphingomonas sp. NFR04]
MNTEQTIELGVASVDTKGGTIGFADVETSLRQNVGLTDD